METLFLSDEIDQIIEKLDYSRLGNNVAIKVHFGEKGCITYLSPIIVKKVYDKIISLGKNATLVECNVLYKGERMKRESHINLARSHGFDFAPIDILDGEKGEEEIIVEVEGGTVENVRLGKGLEKYDSMVVLSHFKGHIAAGYGGVFKNIGMGLGSRGGKLHMHSDISPTINRTKCTGCQECIKNCQEDAIQLLDGKADLNSGLCVGCAMCIAVCPVSAVKIPWGGSSSEGLQKKIIDYSKAVFSVIPKEKMIFINVLKNITSECDCMGYPQEKMMNDIGIISGYDPVALDAAGLDLVMKKSSGKFETINQINKNIQIDYAIKSGLGTKEYLIEKLDQL